MVLRQGRDPGFVRRGREAVDFGNDPPLFAWSGKPAPASISKGAVSWRWLAGVVLTGFTSIILMGVALVAALNSPREFASLPEASSAVAASLPDSIVFGRKGDRIRPVQEPIASRQVMQVSTVTRQGQSDLIKQRPFAKVNTTLTGPNDQLAKQIPAFDILHIFGGTGSDTAAGAAPPTALDDPFYSAKIEGDVTVKISDFPVAAADLDPTAVLATADIEQRLRLASGSKTANAPALTYFDAGPVAAGRTSLAVRIETENVSDIAKTNGAGNPVNTVSERLLGVSQGGDLGALFQANGITGPDVAKIVTALSPLADVAHLKPGQKLRLAFAADADPKTPRLMRASIYQDGAHLATVARADSDGFVRADEPATSLDAVAADLRPDPKPTGDTFPHIYDAVYATALQQQMPKPLVEQLVRIFAFDVDLQARIGPGDSMEVFHSLADPADADAADPEILFASLTLGGVTKRFYRYRTGDDNAVDYYDEAGTSAKKFLLRKPVVEAEITSPFGYRIHPILHERILHSGVDYAAERMTPIFAAGDGVVEEADFNGAYGNFILLKHNNGYQTAYGHQTKFAAGIKPGVKVRQGQVIGYVGSTGVSTGPHVHFEIRINGTPVDPLRVRLPQGRLLSGDILSAFNIERKGLDTLLKPAPRSLNVASAN